ncbi:lipoprotein signal peptidase [Clostridia bacterium]|nr:lipoprotein signal peptidase [Clostridia bacterium]
MYYLLMLLVVGLDQTTKFLVRSNLMPAGNAPGGTISVIPGVFDIIYASNTGAAFSILEGMTIFLIAFSAIVIAALMTFIFLRLKKEPQMLLMGLSLIAAGGLGNLIDRVRFGYVVDFFSFMTFPVFNVADIAVCTGCGLTVLNFVLSEYRAWKQKKDASNETE